MLQDHTRMLGQEIISIVFVTLAILFLIFARMQPPASPARKARMRTGIIFGIVGVVLVLAHLWATS